MKAIKYLSILALSLIATSCMNEFDEPLFSEPPFGNNEIGEANMTIADLKAEYASTISGNSVKQITEDIIIEGVVVANDESGNVYKQFIINDETGAMVIGVNDVGLYAMVPKGQRVRIACKDLYIGGYGKMAQIGGLYNGKVGRMNKNIYPQHVRLIGIPDPTQPEMQPQVIDDSFFTNENKNNLAKFVRLEGVEIIEANGKELWAPEEKKNSSNVVERKIKMGKTNLVLRMSTYADFANEAIPTGKLNINGVMTRYNDYWQFVISHTTDIEKVSE
jgi:RPA family protein